MDSILIKDTTREQREKIVKESRYISFCSFPPVYILEK